MIHLALAFALAAEPSTSAREIVYYPADIPVINTQLGYVTAVYLPPNETIMWDKDHPIHVGNADFFEITANGPVLYIHPMDLPKSMDASTGGKATNVAIDLASGNHIELLVREVSKTPGVHADLKVVIKEGDKSQVLAAAGAPRFVPAPEVDALRKELRERDAAIEDARKKQESANVNAAVAEAQSINTGYEIYDRKGRDRLSVAVYRDSRFTYLTLKDSDGKEAPTLFEFKDGKPEKVEYLLQGKTYTVQHLIDDGEIRAGKSSLKFKFVKE